QLDLVLARAARRDLERALQTLGVRPEALGGVVAGLTGGDEERPVARLEEQQLAQRVIGRALAQRIARRVVREGEDLRRGAAHPVPHPVRLWRDPGRVIIVLTP